MTNQEKNNKLGFLFREAYCSCMCCDRSSEVRGFFDDEEVSYRLREGHCSRTLYILEKSLRRPNEIEDHVNINHLIDLCKRCSFDKPLVANDLDKNYYLGFISEQ